MFFFLGSRSAPSGCVRPVTNWLFGFNSIAIYDHLWSDNRFSPVSRASWVVPLLFIISMVFRYISKDIKDRIIWLRGNGISLMIYLTCLECLCEWHVRLVWRWWGGRMAGHLLHNKDRQMSGQVREMRQKHDRERGSCAVVAHNKYMQLFPFGFFARALPQRKKKTKTCDDKVSWSRIGCKTAK